LFNVARKPTGSNHHHTRLGAGGDAVKGVASSACQLAATVMSIAGLVAEAGKLCREFGSGMHKIDDDRFIRILQEYDEVLSTPRE